MNAKQKSYLNCRLPENQSMYGSAPLRYFLRFSTTNKPHKALPDGLWSQLLASCPRRLKDVMRDSGLRNGEVIRMRFEYINWEGAFYFNPKGKTRKARRQVPLSERVISGPFSRSNRCER